jgi:hypothetical protein
MGSGPAAGATAAVPGSQGQLHKGLHTCREAGTSRSHHEILRTEVHMGQGACLQDDAVQGALRVITRAFAAFTVRCMTGVLL